MSVGGLTTRQVEFIQNYLETGNAVQAALKAGYSYKSAKHASYRFLQNPKVRAEIERNRLDPEYVKGIKDENVRILLRVRDYEVERFNNLVQLASTNNDPLIQEELEHKADRVRKAVMDLAKVTGQFNESVSLYGNINGNVNILNFSALMKQVHNYQNGQAKEGLENGRIIDMGQQGLS